VKRPGKLTIAALLTTIGLTVWALTGSPLTVRYWTPDAQHQLRIDQVRSDIVHLQGLGNRTSREKQWEAARWIAARLEGLALPVAIDSYERDGACWPNVVARLRGESDDQVLVVSHFDSIAHCSGDAPGADDNATGVAAMLQVARDLAQTRLHRSVVFASFSNEERGLGGSASYAAKAKKRGDSIAAVVNIDILGYNRPSRPALLHAAWPHGSLKYRVKGAWRGLRNYAVGLVDGDDVLLVAGREPNRRLVETVAAALVSVPGIHVKQRVDDECG
jgi:acetylornithine deacetylase/succinyl-diaminopimelate desuccinylase-like protein